MRLYNPQRCVDFSGEVEVRAEYDSERFLEPDGVRTVWERADDRIHVSNEILKSPYGRDDRCDLCGEEEAVWSGEAVCISGFSSWRLCFDCYEALVEDRISCLGCNETMIKGSE